MIFASTWIGFSTGPPNMPECRSRLGALDDHLFKRQSAQHHRDRRRRGVPHAGVADKREIGGREFVPVRGEKAGQRGRARLLFALEQKCDVAGQSAIRLEGAAGFEKGHQLTFVVRGAAGDDVLAVLALGKPRRERLGLPQFKRIRRLHVIMAVEQHMRRILALRLGVANDDRMAGRLAHLGRVAEPVELILEPVRGAQTLRREGGIGRNGRDAQKIEQAFARSVEIGVYRREDGVDRGHELSSPGEKPKLVRMHGEGKARRRNRRHGWP